jgi:DNA-binding beta-propeller fold protein YncE
MMRFVRQLRVVLLACIALLPACEQNGNGIFPGAGDLRLLVATRGSDALELFDAQTLDAALDTPTGLPGAPAEARPDRDLDLFVTGFTDGTPARAFDSRLFERVPASEMPAGGFIEFDHDHDRIYLAREELAFFDDRSYAPVGREPVDLGGEASDVLYDPATRRIFVAVTTPSGPRLRVFGGDDLSEVAGSPVELPGEAGGRTGDLLLVGDRSQLFVLLPDASLLAAIDPSNLRSLARTPVALRAPATALARDSERERLYAGAADGRLESISATDFSPTASFPRTVATSISDLAFDPVTDRLFVADAGTARIVVLDAVTLDEVRDSPVRLGGVPVSVDVIDLR